MGAKERHTAKDIHARAGVYRNLLNTEDRLLQLVKCELLNVYATKEERCYRITGEGSKFLRRTSTEQAALLRKYLWRAEIPKKCCVCGGEAGLTWYRNSYYCDLHLNSKDTPIPRQSRVSSPLGWD
jgi:hypothetical protein